MSACRLTVAALAAALLVSSTACTNTAVHPSPTSSRSVSTSASTSTSTPSTPAAALRSSQIAQLSGEELSYGAGVSAAAGVVYQPDVIQIGGGAGAVRSVSGSGLTWIVDAHAPGADQLAVGKIMLATSFGTGRVLKLTRSGADVTVVLGPVSLTDVISDADLGSATPIPIGETLAYTTPSAPGTVVDDPGNPFGAATSAFVAPPPPSSAPTQDARGPSTGGRVTLARAMLPAAPATVGLPAPSTTPSTVGAGDFQVTPFCCAGGVGINIGYDKGDGRLRATLLLKLDRPTASFRLEISHGKLVEATVQVHGAGAVQVAIDAATRSSAGDFQGKTIHVPETLTIPLTGFGVPLVLSLTQDFFMSLQLTGESAFHTKGGYSISGDLGFGYVNGKPQLTGTTLAIDDPMTANTRVLGVASGVITVGWGLKVSIGVGVLGFSAGVWYELRVALSVVADGLSLTAGCVRDALVVTGEYGVGWTVPAAVVAVLNFFLHAVRANTIAASGGKSWGPTELWRPTPGDYCRTTQQ